MSKNLNCFLVCCTCFITCLDRCFHRDILSNVSACRALYFSSPKIGKEIKKCCNFKNLALKNWQIIRDSFQLLKLGQSVFGKPLFGKMMKVSFYGQFVAGEDRVGIKPAIHRMHSFGVKSILDYSVEEDITSERAEELELKYESLSHLLYCLIEIDIFLTGLADSKTLLIRTLYPTRATTKVISAVMLINENGLLWGYVLGLGVLALAVLAFKASTGVFVLVL